MPKSGILSKTYRNTGNFGTPTWVEVPIIGDLAISATWNRATAPTRETPVERGVRTTLPLSVSGKMRVADTDTNYLAFDNAAHASGTLIDLMILNGSSTTNGVTGWRAEFELVNWSEDQATGNALMKDWEVIPTLSTNLPKRTVVSSGAPVFTDVT